MWADGLIRLWPPWEPYFGHHTVPGPAAVAVMLGVIFGLLLVYPFLARRFSGDDAHHNLLQRLRDVPVRTAVGATTTEPRPGVRARTVVGRLLIHDGTMTGPPAVLVFDVNETLIDINSLAPIFEHIFGDRRVLREWFGQVVMYSMTATLSGHYVDFFTLGQGLLRMLAPIHRTVVTDDDVHGVKQAMLTMPAHPDGEGGLATLRDNGFRLVTLTNSPPNPDGASPLEHAGLADFFERQFSAHACRAFKPAPTTYRQSPPSRRRPAAAHGRRQ